MPTYSAITSGQVDAESPIDTTLAGQWTDNVLAIQTGDATAPDIVEGALASASVNQANLKTATDENSVTTGTSLTTLTSGDYGFWPQVKADNTSSVAHMVGIVSSVNVAGTAINTALTTAYVTYVHLGADSARTTYANFRYVQASPPYDLGDGEIPIFIFMKVDKKGNPLLIKASPEAPWHYNGPTCIRATRKKGNKSYRKVSAIAACCYAENTTPKELLETRKKEFLDMLDKPSQIIELTQEIKNRDMDMIPHPWGLDKNDGEIIMLNPVSDIGEKLLMLQQEGESIASIFNDGYLKIGSSINRAGPKGVKIVDYKWR